jgi:hypothetical protein
MVWLGGDAGRFSRATTTVVENMVEQDDSETNTASAITIAHAIQPLLHGFCEPE